MSLWKNARALLYKVQRSLDPEARRQEQENREALHREVEALLERGRAEPPTKPPASS